MHNCGYFCRVKANPEGLIAILLTGLQAKRNENFNARHKEHETNAKVGQIMSVRSLDRENSTDFDEIWYCGQTLKFARRV